MEQLPQPHTGLFQGCAALGRNAVKPPAASFRFVASLDPPIPFHAAEHRIEGAGADAVTMVPQFLDHPIAKKATFLGVMQDMHPDEAEEQALQRLINGLTHRNSITNFVTSEIAPAAARKIRRVTPFSSRQPPAELIHARLVRRLWRLPSGVRQQFRDPREKLRNGKRFAENRAE